jgi:type IV fimbrial biogenesis protein FimT
MRGSCPLTVKIESGFTLAELIIVMAIFGILTAIAIPTLVSMMPKYRLNGAARQVMGDLMAARMKAVSLNKKVKVFFFNDHQYKVCDDENNNGKVSDGEGDVQTIDIQIEYPDVKFDLNKTSDPTFSPRGTATNRTITLQNSSGSKKITISIAGRVKIN